MKKRPAGRESIPAGRKGKDMERIKLSGLLGKLSEMSDEIPGVTFRRIGLRAINGRILEIEIDCEVMKLYGDETEEEITFELEQVIRSYFRIYDIFRSVPVVVCVDCLTFDEDSDFVTVNVIVRGIGSTFEE